MNRCICVIVKIDEGKVDIDYWDERLFYDEDDIFYDEDDKEIIKENE